MQTFVCDQCDHVDVDNGDLQGGQYICTKCRTGDWHGMFAYEPYEQSRHHNVVNRNNSNDQGSVSFS